MKVLKHASEELIILHYAAKFYSVPVGTILQITFFETARNLIKNKVTSSLILLDFR